MNLEIGRKVRVINLDHAEIVFEQVLEASASKYFARRKGSVGKIGELSGKLHPEFEVYYVQFTDGTMTPYYKDELTYASW